MLLLLQGCQLDLEQAVLLTRLGDGVLVRRDRLGLGTQGQEPAGAGDGDEREGAEDLGGNGRLEVHREAPVCFGFNCSWRPVKASGERPTVPLKVTPVPSDRSEEHTSELQSLMR